MRRNLAPAIMMTNEQRQKVDENVLAVIRGAGMSGLRMGEILIDGRIEHVIAGLPATKPDHRYVGESLQRLKQGEKIELVCKRWRTTSPTS